MTTREQIIAAAKECGIGWAEGIGGMPEFLETFYAIAFEAGRQAERKECAMDVEFYIKHSVVAKSIAEDIRARSTK